MGNTKSKGQHSTEQQSQDAEQDQAQTTPPTTTLHAYAVAKENTTPPLALLGTTSAGAAQELDQELTADEQEQEVDVNTAEQAANVAEADVAEQGATGAKKSVTFADGLTDEQATAATADQKPARAANRRTGCAPPTDELQQALQEIDAKCNTIRVDFTM